jgi:hypothetical protein
MRRLLGILIAALLLTGALGTSPAAASNWSQGWHWPRWHGLGSTATETRVYFVADSVHLKEYQREYVTWAAHRWSVSPALVAIPVTRNRCPTRADGRLYNCVVFQSMANTGYAGLTTLAFDSNKHITFARVQFDVGVGRTQLDQDRNIAIHEAFHALGGGFDNPTTTADEHYCCDGSGYPTAHDYAELARVYNHHG